MLISCPQCRAVYNISTDYIPENGKKFKCAECGNIWMVYPNQDSVMEPEVEDDTPVDTVVTENTATDIAPQPETTADITNSIDDDIDVMFSRLSHNTKNLFTSGNAVENMTTAEKIRHYIFNNFSVYMLYAFLTTVAVILGGKLVYDYRYEIVAKVPMMEQLYARFNTESVYRGKDLAIQNVRIREIINKDNEPELEISGRLYNVGKQTVRLLPVKASIIDADERVEDEVTEILSEHKLEPQFATLFRIVLKSPTENARKVKIVLDNGLN